MANIFYKWGIHLFDAKLKEYGGFNHFIAYKVFRGKFDYIIICFTGSFEFKAYVGKNAIYHDGYHNVLSIGWLKINWGT